MNVIPSNISWGFTGADLWANAMAVVTSLTPYVMIALAVALAPKILGVLKGLFRSRSS